MSIAMLTTSAFVAACPARGVNTVMFPALDRFQITMAIWLWGSRGALLDNIGEPFIAVAIKQLPPPPPPPPPPPDELEL
jgi:hypothetical protein